MAYTGILKLEIFQGAMKRFERVGGDAAHNLQIVDIGWGHTGVRRGASDQLL